MASLSCWQKIQEGIRIKEEGNAYFKEEKYKKARLAYSKIFAYINGLGAGNDATVNQYSAALKLKPLTEEERNMVQELQVTAYSNIAMCYIKLNEYDNAIEYCDKALALDGRHVKALYRKGRSLAQIKKLDSATECYELAHQFEPTNEVVSKELERIKAVLQRRDQASTKKLAKAMEKLGREGL